MSGPVPPGGPTQDEIMAISLFKMGLKSDDTVLDLGCGSGKISIAAAGVAKTVYSVDRRTEAIEYTKKAAAESGRKNIEFYCGEGLKFLESSPVFDCAFVGGTKGIESMLPILARKVRRIIVVNAVLVNSLAAVTATMNDLGIFREVILVQVSRSKQLGKSMMFKPIDPVYVIVGSGAACS